MTSGVPAMPYGSLTEDCAAFFTFDITAPAALVIFLIGMGTQYICYALAVDSIRRARDSA